MVSGRTRVPDSTTCECVNAASCPVGCLLHAVKLAEEIVKEKTALSGDETHGESQRERGEQGKPRMEGPETVAMPTSDAILSCPACLTTLCLDSQRSLPPNQTARTYVLYAPYVCCCLMLTHLLTHCTYKGRKIKHHYGILLNVCLLLGCLTVQCGQCRFAFRLSLLL